MALPSVSLPGAPLYFAYPVEHAPKTPLLQSGFLKTVNTGLPPHLHYIAYGFRPNIVVFSPKGLLLLPERGEARLETKLTHLLQAKCSACIQEIKSALEGRHQEILRLLTPLGNTLKPNEAPVTIVGEFNYIVFPSLPYLRDPNIITLCNRVCFAAEQRIEQSALLEIVTAFFTLLPGLIGTRELILNVLRGALDETKIHTGTDSLLSSGFDRQPAMSRLLNHIARIQALYLGTALKNAERRS